MSKVDAARLLSSRPANLVAMIVVDVQTGLFNTTPPPFEAIEVIHRINVVTACARVAGSPVFIVQHDGPADGDWLVPFSQGWNLHPELRRESGDVGMRKTTGDAFYGTGLEQELRLRGIRSIVLTGYATEFCIDSTLRNAVSKEFEVFVVSDAHTTNDAPMLKAPAIRQYFNWVWSDSSAPKGIHLLTAAEVGFNSELAVA